MRLPRHFLLIDDSSQDQLLAQEAFKELCPDCSLTSVHSGAQALDLLRNRVLQPDVVLLDVNMPGMNGFEVLQQIKVDPQLATLPVVMLSTSEADKDVTAAYSLHASSYLVKSQNFPDFLEQIDAFLKYWLNARVLRH